MFFSNSKMTEAKFMVIFLIKNIIIYCYRKCKNYLAFYKLIKTDIQRKFLILLRNMTILREFQYSENLKIDG